MAGINWTDQSIIDLVNIAEYIAKDSTRHAKITISRIRKATLQLVIYPLSGRIVPETNIKNIRELILGNYRIIYAIVSSNRIDILTVHHSSMRLNIDELIKKD